MLSSDTLKKRISCRTYKNGPMTESDRQKLKDFLLINVQGPFGNKVRFELIDLAGKERNEIKTLGTLWIHYGCEHIYSGGGGEGRSGHGRLRLLHGKEYFSGYAFGTGHMLAGGHI